MSTLSQRSFAGGEVAPSLYGRVDTTKYQTGLRTCRNNLVMRHGGVSNRPGSEFVCEVKDSSKAVRLLQFVFNSSQTYVLEFGNLYMRVIKEGVLQKLATQNITAITNANPCVVTYAGADNYANGDEVYVSGIVGAIGTYLNNRNFKVANVNVGANTFELDYMDGTNVNSTAMGAYTSGGTLAEIYEISTPYVEADLATLQFAQSGDVLTLVHPNYAPRELARTGDTSWTLSEITFVPDISRPAGCSGSGSAGALTYKYRVTAVKSETFEESLPGLSTNTRTIIGISAAADAVITTSAAHGYSVGHNVYISGITAGPTEINGRTWEILTTPGADTFSISYDSSVATAWSAGGSVNAAEIVIPSVVAPASSTPHSISWTAVTDALEYNVYMNKNGIYGLVGVAGTNSFSNILDTPDFSETPPYDRYLFQDTGEYPSTTTYFQQRRFFANTNADTEKIYGSKIGQFSNFTQSSPLQDDDAVTFKLAGKQVNEVKHLLDVGQLVALTSGGEWAIEGGSGGAIAPTGVNPKQYTSNGSSDLSPIVVGGNALYVQARGSVVRDLAFDFSVDGYRGNDLTIFAAHLFDKYTLLDWCYQQIPHSVVWTVRSDGTLLGLTYVREHQVWAWHKHDTDGTYENVCAVPEGNEDAVYCVVNRTINGATKRYIERFTQRRVDDIVDSVFMDAFYTYDGRNTGVTTMTLSGSGWTYTDTLTLTASASTFSSTDVGKGVHMTGSDGTIIRATITAYTSATVVDVMPNISVPVTMQATAITDWALAKSVITGLWHLEGEDVAVFADGYVAASPNNEAYTVVTVADGTVTLDQNYGVIHIGLPYLSDIETLDIDSTQSETLSDKFKIVHKVTAFVEETRGVWAGARPPEDDATDPLDGLTELKARSDEGYDSPVDLQTGTVEINIQPEWNSNGRVFIRQVDPVPMSILAISPAGLYPFKKSVG